MRNILVGTIILLHICVKINTESVTKDTKNAANAPIANHIETKFTVASSINNRTTNKIIQ